ncbi:VWA domain-containing protein [Kineosporia sp. A_224]|uniref:vWA domain-containing protein n=1 Tax=Kineosporia sp. A_224 TaxID=1962180 RepID=UPI000B4B40F8|nr:VWA domain-containing protein [Kineosporia sp. A_224]
MTFAWPWMLVGLLAVPLLVGGYRRLLRSRDERRERLAAQGIVAPAAARGRRRRHVAPALLLAALTLLLVALARPQATVASPRREGTVVLAFDTSSSMAATDVAPTRMEAAKAAARTFVRRQPAQVRIGVVAFGEGGLVVQQPTTDRAQVLAAVDRLSPQGGTSIGRGIQTSLSAIAGRVVEVDESGGGGVEASGGDIGYYGSAAVVMLSDGENTSGPDPLEVAAIASTAGVKVYPVGLGSAAGTVLQVDGFQLATKLDEPLLREVARTTDGTYYAAADGAALEQVYRSIDLAWTVRTEKIEVTALLAGIAALLLLVGAGLSFVWFGRVV